VNFVETCLTTSRLLRQLPQMEVFKGIDGIYEKEMSFEIKDMKLISGKR
jgi:hypothetical protein